MRLNLSYSGIFGCCLSYVFHHFGLCSTQADSWIFYLKFWIIRQRDRENRNTFKMFSYICTCIYSYKRNDIFVFLMNKSGFFKPYDIYEINMQLTNCRCWDLTSLQRLILPSAFCISFSEVFNYLPQISMLSCALSLIDLRLHLIFFKICDF